ncbi:MAG: hypothetical protein DI551_00370 [Micavibrio aeruginosavorus]|uniref:Type IV secretion protein IcmC n=1 Tax=Micavibrio aeruginosavorus TaxID=349221 RepID=A0A2W5QCI3_9BACT|nr:MAG: hypothetical protein DI551_00370 [Micavibrio aeruginosavorus]
MTFKSKNFIYFLGVMALALFGAAAPSLAQEAANGDTLGGVINNVTTDLKMTLPGVFSGFSYLMGLILGYQGIVKLKDHIENPNQVPQLDPIKRFIAGGAFFAMPYVADVLRQTIEGGDRGADYTNSDFNGASSGVGLDAMIVALMENVFVPLQWAFGAFGYIAGLMLVMIGISRLLKSEQDGPRGPATIGTLMTFIVAGCLFSINSIIAYFTTTMFDDASIDTNGVLQYTAGLGGAADHVHAVISAIIAFALIVGWVSLIRGIFLLRGVSEGSQQASMMAAITHLIGGALAINLGSVIMAVQETLGITAYGIVFN